MIMGNKGIQMEIDYMVEEDHRDIEQILDKYVALLETSAGYEKKLSEQERQRYFSTLCAENEQVNGVIYIILLE